MLSSCGNNKEPDKPKIINDKDFDGLSYDIDPDDNNNVYKYCQVTHYEGEEILSKEDDVTVDYRPLLSDNYATYNKNIAKMCSLLCSTTAETDMVEGIKVTNNVYKNEESSTNDLFVQFGLKNLKKIFKRPADNVDDKLDVVGFVSGENKFEYNDKKYQVIVTSITAYYLFEGWSSNFDIGADTEGYEESYGESPNWDKKEYHKGFYVSAKRAYKDLVDYVKTVKTDGYEQVLLVTGHSRGGAIANLIGTFLQDDNYKNVCYCFAPPAVIATEGSTLKEYNNILCFFNESDVIPNMPPYSWNGFKTFGKSYTFSLKDSAEKWQELYDTEYTYLSKGMINTVINFFNEVTPSREGLYEFSEKAIDEIYDTKEEADERVNSLKSKYPKHPIFETATKLEVAYEEGYYVVYYSQKPCIVTDMVMAVLNSKVKDITTILTVAEDYSPYVDEYLSSFISKFISDFGTLVAGIVQNHVVKAYTLGIDLI